MPPTAAPKPDNPLGAYLKDRRSRLDPVACGFSTARRRTPGLRREEVAQRVNISPTWYTWLEQGRGGAPSAEVLDRLATGVMLSLPEREHLFMLGRGHPPSVRYVPGDGVTPRLQRVLDALGSSPAILRTVTWDVVGWNRAAAVVMTDYGSLPPEERNILRLIFCNPRVRRAQVDWEGVARFVVAAFRADATRAGAFGEVAAFVDELCGRSPEFESLWRDHEVKVHGDGTSACTMPRRDSSNWSTQALPSKAGRIWAWWSTTPSVHAMPSASPRCSMRTAQVPIHAARAALPEG